MQPLYVLELLQGEADCIPEGTMTASERRAGAIGMLKALLLHQNATNLPAIDEGFALSALRCRNV